MIALKGLMKPVALLFLLVACASCALTPVTGPQEVYYTIPPITYFRESPDYASPNVATVYRGEQVKILSKTADNWCRVQTVQGQQIGWMQRALLSPVPIPTETFIIRENEVPLRDAPQKEGSSRQILQRGDKVRKLSENQQGWWWVLVEKDQSLGWLPPAVTASATEKAAPGPTAEPGKPSSPLPPPKPNYFVATANLNLYLLPLVDSKVVKVLRFNDKVEKIAQSGADWFKVRYPETGAQGWARAIALTESPLPAPKVFPAKRKKALKRFGPLKPAEPGTTQPEELEPEVM